MTVYDLAVVGGGLVGSAVAYEAVRLGARVVLVDRADPGRATDAGAGILSPETIGVADRAWFALAVASGEHHRALDALLRDAGIAETGYEPCAALRIAFREQEDPYWADYRAVVLERSGAVLEEISPDQAQELFPPLRSARAALINPRAARLDGGTLNQALRAAAAARGLVVVDGSVSGFETSERRVDAVATADGVLACGAVVVAGGAWTPETASALAVDLPVRPVRGQIVHLHLDGADTSRWPILQPLMSHYAVPWSGGRVAVGATFDVDAGFDARPTAGGMRILFSEMLRVMPGLADATLVDVRVGLRPVCADDTPVLGPLPGWENAFVCTGHGANGLLLGPFSGHVTARAALGEDPGLDLAPFGADRFEGGTVT